MTVEKTPIDLGLDENEEIKGRVRLAAKWLYGKIEEGRRVPNLAYIKAGSEEDRQARMSLAQLLVDGNAPRDVLELLASCIAPDFRPPDGISLPATGEPITPTNNPLRIIREQHPRRLDFAFRTGGRKRGAPQKTDPVRDGKILQKVMERLANGDSKTNAFKKVSENSALTPEAVRHIWNVKYRPLTELWEAENRGRR